MNHYGFFYVRFEHKGDISANCLMVFSCTYTLASPATLTGGAGKLLLQRKDAFQASRQGLMANGRGSEESPAKICWAGFILKSRECQENSINKLSGVVFFFKIHFHIF